MNRFAIADQVVAPPPSLAPTFLQDGLSVAR